MELPKEDQKPAEQNGPVEGQGDASRESQSAEQSTDSTAQTTTEKKLPEMDIDWIPALVYIRNYNKALSCWFYVMDINGSWVRTAAFSQLTLFGWDWSVWSINSWVANYSVG